jgi:hypothetical protein
MSYSTDSEEQLGEHAPAGVPALEVDKKGISGRWGQDGTPVYTGEPVETEGPVVPGADSEVVPYTQLPGVEDVAEEETAGVEDIE